MKKTFLLVLFAAFFLTILHGQKFTLAVIPDTQVEVTSDTAMFINRMQWIANSKDSLNIPFVLHVGDVVNFDTTLQYCRASDGFALLDKARIPYAIALGNHDTEAVGWNYGHAAPGNTHLNVRKTTKFNQYFPVKRFAAQCGRFQDDRSDNAYYTFNAGGLQWLVVALEFCPRREAVAWADEVVRLYPKHNVIVLTHYHLNGNGEIVENNGGYGDMSPIELFNEFYTRHPNILLVLSGHTVQTSWRNDKGVHGNRIYQILQDYQNEDKGGGYLRLLEMDVDKKIITGKMYSPHYDKTKTDHSQLRFTAVKFIKPE